MKVFNDERAIEEGERESTEEAREARRKARAELRAKFPRCKCGCGKRALWPLHYNNPIFHTRLCGYIHALKSFDERAWKLEYDYRESLKKKNRPKPPPRRPPGRRKRIPA